MEAIQAFFDTTLGLGIEPRHLNVAQVATRGIVVFVVALIMVRLADRRFLSKKTAFDAILGFILASMLARAVNGSAAFWPTLACGLVLVGLHRLLAMLARHSHPFGELVKGRGDLLIKDGQIQPETMRFNDLSPRDLEEGLRLKGGGAGRRRTQRRYQRGEEVKTINRVRPQFPFSPQRGERPGMRGGSAHEQSNIRVRPSASAPRPPVRRRPESS